MGSPGVRQLEFLSRVFGELVGEFDPESLLLLGCATGNGLERLVSGRLRRIIALDINPEYIEVCRKRYAERIPGLELVRADAMSFEIESASIDFVHAALFFEYVEPAAALEKIARWLIPGGILAVVLQMPHDSGANVSETDFESVKLLEPAIHLVDPQLFGRLARERGFSELGAVEEALESGKKFFIGVYRLERARK
jgi:ubiquinone/menaquinone biosynthesis C-methylase UbiE